MDKVTDTIEIKQKTDAGQGEPASIGILFGSFNPPHSGHVNTIKRAKHHIGLDEAWMVPTKRSPLKKHIAQASLQQKLAMCRVLALPHRKWLKVHDALETDSTGYAGTLRAAFTMAATLTREHPNKQFHIIGGADNGIAFRMFVYSLRLSAMAQTLRQTPKTALRSGIRAGFTQVSQSLHNYKFVKLERSNNGLGSTEIRNSLTVNEKPDGCPAPLAYLIKRQAIYHCNPKP